MLNPFRRHETPTFSVLRSRNRSRGPSSSSRRRTNELERGPRPAPTGDFVEVAAPNRSRSTVSEPPAPPRRMDDAALEQSLQSILRSLETMDRQPSPPHTPLADPRSSSGTSGSGGIS